MTDDDLKHIKSRVDYWDSLNLVRQFRDGDEYADEFQSYIRELLGEVRRLKGLVNDQN